MGRDLRLRLAATCLLTLGAFPAFAAAQEPANPPADVDERARAHFQSGRAYFDTADYESALREFNQAYALSHRPALLYNIYAAHERLGNLEEAIRYLERYLAEGGEIPDRATLEVRLRNLRARVADASASTASTSTSTSTGTGASREPAGEEPTPRSDTNAGEGAPPAPVHADERAGSGGLSVVPLVAYGVGAAGVIAFAMFGALALLADSSPASSCAADTTRTCTERDVAPMDRFALFADIGLLMAIAGTATGTILVLGSSDDDNPGERARIGAAPWIADRSAGASVRGTF